jgi:hypothetical protein
LCGFELSYKFTSNRLLPSWFACGSWLVLYTFNFMLVWFFVNPFVLFEDNARMFASLTLAVLMVFELAVFAAHIDINPQLLLWSFLYAYFQNIKHSGLMCWRGVVTL